MHYSVPQYTNITELTTHISALPARINYLDFNGWDLSVFSGAELVQIFSAIPPYVKILALRNNHLGRIISPDLVQALAAIPKTIRTLNLNENEFNLKSSASLKLIFAAIPDSITELSLGFNALWVKTGIKIARAYSALPHSIVKLRLNGNFIALSAVDMAQAFAGIPSSVVWLDLGNNELIVRSIQEINQAFSAIPVTVKGLRLQDNSLYYMPVAECVQLIAAIPKTITHLIMYDAFHRNDAELEQIAYALVGRRIIDENLVKPMGIMRGVFFKTMPLYLEPGTWKITRGALFDTPFYRQALPLLFRPIYDKNSAALPTDIVAKIYAFLNYKEICSLALAKTTPVRKAQPIVAVSVSIEEPYGACYESKKRTCILS